MVKGALAVKAGMIEIVVGLILFFSIPEYALVGLGLAVWGMTTIFAGVVVIKVSKRLEAIRRS